MADEYTPSPIMTYFAYEHLPEPLKGVSVNFSRVAEHVEDLRCYLLPWEPRPRSSRPLLWVR